jgi:hypothetical protein
MGQDHGRRGVPTLNGHSLFLQTMTLSIYQSFNQSIFLAYTRQSSIGWSHALQGPLCLHWGLLCQPLCCIESQTIPSNPLNGPGHLSGQYKSILKGNGLANTPLFMGQPTHLPRPHTGFPSWHKSQRPTIKAPPLQLMNYHSHLVFSLPSSQSKPLISWKQCSFSFKLAKST